MPCDYPRHPDHEWPTEGKLKIYACEQFCHFCRGQNAARRYYDACGLRRHAQKHIDRGEYPGLKIEWPFGYVMKYEGPFTNTKPEELPEESRLKREAESPLRNDRMGFQPATQSDRHFGWSLAGGPGIEAPNLQAPATPISLREYASLIAQQKTGSVKIQSNGSPVKAYASPATTNANSTSPSQASSNGRQTSLNSRPQSSGNIPESQSDDQQVESNAVVEKRVYAPLEEVHTRFRNQVIALIEFGRAIGLTTIEMGYLIDDALHATMPGWLMDETETQGEEATKVDSENSAVSGDEDEEGEEEAEAEESEKSEAGDMVDWNGDCSRL